MRTAKTPARKALDRLRTKTWIHGIRAAAVERDRLPTDISFGTLETAVAKKHAVLRSFVGSKLLNKYASGTRTPTPSTLDRFERVYPGTRPIFDEGPDGSQLWRAIDCRDADSAAVALFGLKSDIQHGVPAQIPIRRRRGRPLGSVLVPATLARRLRLFELPLAARNATLRRLLKRRPDLRDSLAWIVDEKAAAAEGGPVLSPRPEISFSADERSRQGAVVPPVLACLSIQLLRGIQYGGAIVMGGARLLAVELRLRFEFGLQDSDLADLIDLCPVTIRPGNWLEPKGSTSRRRHQQPHRRWRRRARAHVGFST